MGTWNRWLKEASFFCQLLVVRAFYLFYHSNRHYLRLGIHSFRVLVYICMIDNSKIAWGSRNTIDIRSYCGGTLFMFLWDYMDLIVIKIYSRYTEGSRIEVEAIWTGWNSKIPNTSFIFCIWHYFRVFKCTLKVIFTGKEAKSKLICFPYTPCAHSLKVILLNVVVSCLGPVTGGHMQDFSAYGI